MSCLTLPPVKDKFITGSYVVDEILRKQKKDGIHVFFSLASLEFTPCLPDDTALHGKQVLKDIKKALMKGFFREAYKFSCLILLFTMKYPASLKASVIFPTASSMISTIPAYVLLKVSSMNAYFSTFSLGA